MLKPPSTIAMNEQNDCPLFQLPPELRNEIYAYTLSSNEPASEKKSTTRLPLESPLEVIDLNDALRYIRPSNELLVTCRYIYTEARGVSVAAQREFWASNNFIIDLNDDWKSETNTDGAIKNDRATNTERATKPRIDVASLRCEYLNLMPKLVLAVRQGSYYNEHHLIPTEGPLWLPEEGICKPIGAQLVEWAGFYVAWRDVHSLMRACYDTFFARNSNSAALRVRKYTLLAIRYVRIGALRRGTSKLELQMLRGLERVTTKGRKKRDQDMIPLQRLALSAAIEHLCDGHGVLPSRDVLAK
jgi:hypothetical protein